MFQDHHRKGQINAACRYRGIFEEAAMHRREKGLNQNGGIGLDAHIRLGRGSDGLLQARVAVKTTAAADVQNPEGTFLFARFSQDEIAKNRRPPFAALESVAISVPIGPADYHWIDLPMTKWAWHQGVRFLD